MKSVGMQVILLFFIRHFSSRSQEEITLILLAWEGKMIKLCMWNHFHLWTLLPAFHLVKKEATSCIGLSHGNNSMVNSWESFLNFEVCSITILILVGDLIDNYVKIYDLLIQIQVSRFSMDMWCWTHRASGSWTWRHGFFRKLLHI